MRKRWFTPQLFPSHQDITEGLRAIELVDFHCTNHVNCIDTSHSIAHNHLNPMMMAVGPVITHKKSNNIRISYGPKVKALGLYMA